MKTNKKLGLLMIMVGLILFALPVTGLVQLASVGDVRQLFACDSLSETGTANSQGIGSWTVTTGSSIDTANKLEGTGSILMVDTYQYYSYMSSISHSFTYNTDAQFTTERTVRLSTYMSAINDFKSFFLVLSEYRPSSNGTVDYVNWQWSIPLKVGWQTVDISLDSSPLRQSSTTGETYTSPLLEKVTLIGVTYITNSDSNPVVNIDNICVVCTSGSFVTAPTVTIAPATSSLTYGQTQSFTATVTGGTSPYLYSWYLDGEAIITLYLQTNTYTTPSTLSIGNHSVYVSVTADDGQTATSATATITVSATSDNTTTPEDPPDVTDGQATLIVSAGTGGTASPLGTSTCAVGNTVVLTATANSGYTFSYWLFNNGTKVNTNPLSLLMDDSYSVLAVFEQSSTTPNSTTQNSFSDLLSPSIMLQMFSGLLVVCGVVVFRKK